MARDGSSWVATVGGSKSATVEFEKCAYLAGPDVFFPNAKENGKRMVEFLAGVGIKGFFPLDNEPQDPEIWKKPREAKRWIYEQNMKMMKDCVNSPNKIGIIIANMTPFHGPSMDGGTAFEMCRFATFKEFYPDRVVIVGYSTNPSLFEDRVIEQVYGGKENVEVVDGILRGKKDGNMIEAFGGRDNLMMDCAAEEDGARICSSFEEAANLANELASKLIEKNKNKPLRSVPVTALGFN